MWKLVETEANFSFQVQGDPQNPDRTRCDVQAIWQKGTDTKVCYAREEHFDAYHAVQWAESVLDNALSHAQVADPDAIWHYKGG